MPSQPRRLRILVLDDQKTALLMLQAHLEGAGHEVLTTSGWATLTKAAFSVPPDVLILDLNMPALPGERIAPILRRHFPKAKLILFSAESSERLQAAKEACKADYVFAKNAVQGLLGALAEIAREPPP